MHMVTMMTPEDRRALDELYREQDRLLADDAQWQARREALARESAPSGVTVGRTIENARVATSDDDAGDWRDEVARAMAEVIVVTKREMRCERRAERAAEQCDRNAEIAKFQTEIDAMRGEIAPAIRKSIDLMVKEVVWRERMVFERRF